VSRGLPRALRLASLAGFAALTAPFAAQALSATLGEEEAAPDDAGDIEIIIEGLRSNKGLVAACLTARAEIFPDCDKDARALSAVAPADSTVRLRFAKVPSGRYAIAVLHDANGNRKADRVLGMIPREGFGFSRNAKVTMGPPSFESASFEHGGTKQIMTIRMRYLF